MVLTRSQRARMVTRKRELVEGIDRLSELPDHLIYLIFSFIDTKYMVMACVLSTRYKVLWRSLTSFQFYERMYPNYKFFTNFIKQVLSRCDGSEVKSFSLEFNYIGDPFFLKYVIKYVLLHVPKHLKLIVGDYNYYTLLKPIYALQSFESLHAPCARFYPSHTCNFPLITTLYLENPSFYDPSGFAEPFSGCPNLKDMTLYNCAVDLKILGIECQNLEKLDISVGACPTDFSLVIKGPKLNSLKYKGDALAKVSADVPVVKDVHLDCIVHHDGSWHKRVMNVIDLFKEFLHSKRINHGLGIMQVLVSSSVFRQEFPHLFNNFKNIVRFGDD